MYKANEYKTNEYKSQIKQKVNSEKGCCFTSNLLTESLKEFESNSFNEQTREIKSEKKITSIGEIYMEYYPKEENKTYILENYKTIRFSREEIQIYLALLNVYMKNVRKKDYGIRFEFSTKDFHNNVLGRKNRLRKEDLQRYEDIFSKIRRKEIIYNAENATIKPFNKKEFKNVRINSTLLNIDIISYDNYKDQVIRINPSALTMLELQTIKQISNFFPIDVIRLGFDKSDNILYFALYLTKIHRNNESHIDKEKGKKAKRVYNKAFKKEITLKTIIENALPNHKELFNKFENYKERSKGKHFFDKQILKPLKETLEIFESHGYIDKHFKLPNYDKNIVDKKIELIFNYDTGKLIEI